MSIISHNIKLNIFIQNSRQRERYHDQVIRITEVVNNFPFNIKKKLSSIYIYIYISFNNNNSLHLHVI